MNKMKRSLSQRKIIERFDSLDNCLTVMSFDSNGRRLLTRSGLNIITAFGEVSQKTNLGLTVRVFLNIPSKDQSPSNIDEINTDYLI